VIELDRQEKVRREHERIQARLKAEKEEQDRLVNQQEQEVAQ
jgi:hypothetical protein